MAKYRKKPVVIEAVQWVGGPKAMHDIIGLAENRDDLAFRGIPPHEIQIKTLEGAMTAHFDDWIIKGVQGELYLRKPDIFKQTYELIE